MYTKQDLENVKGIIKKRWLIALIPTVVLLAVAIAVFVYGRSIRSEKLWLVTAVLTAVAGCWFLFLFGVYLRPALIYRKNLGFMLNGRMRETVGLLTEIAEDSVDHEGMEVYALNVNVGDRDDRVDDRTLYLDVYKPRPAEMLGKRVKVLSNDKMISSIAAVDDQKGENEQC